MKGLAWLGRQRSKAIAALIVFAIGLPAVGEILRPLVTEAVFGLLVLAFLRTDYSILRSHLKRPLLVIIATIWTTVLIPVILVLISSLSGLKTLNPDLYLGLLLQAIASPITAAPAIAVIIGLDATLVLITLVASTILVPISAPMIINAFGLELTLSPFEFGLKLFCLLAGAVTLALIGRKLLGEAAIKSHSDEFDGLNILILFVFISAVMGGLGQQILSQPGLVIALTLLAFIISFVLMAVTYTLFRFAGTKQALALGMLASQRNMGLMIAGTGGLVPELTWIYFAVSQFPLYLSPLLLSPIVRWLNSDKQQTKSN